MGVRVARPLRAPRPLGVGGGGGGVGGPRPRQHPVRSGSQPHRPRSSTEPNMIINKGNINNNSYVAISRPSHRVRAQPIAATCVLTPQRPAPDESTAGVVSAGGQCEEHRDEPKGSLVLPPPLQAPGNENFLPHTAEMLVLLLLLNRK